MPAFARDEGGSLASEDLQQLYAYVRFLAGSGSGNLAAAPGATPASAAPVSGATGVQAGGPKPPNQIPHGIKGWGTKCLSCHGKVGFAPVKVSHAGRTNQTCLFCHALKPGVPETFGLQNVAPSSSEAPRIPHAVVAGGPRCDSCHSAAGFQPLPQAHEAYKPTPCEECHDPGTPPATPIPTGSPRR
jgi:hypothetical protein